MLITCQLSANLLKSTNQRDVNGSILSAGGGGEVDLNAIMKQGNIYYKKKRESEENAKMLFGRKIEASFVIIYIRKMLVEV